jgi:hypothetical protein
MADTLSTAKRTRSQLTLPDDILHLPERSPMKDARIAFRNHSIEVAGSHPECSGDSDDELLLSPGKTSQPGKASQQRTNLIPKRSASPPLRDEYTSRSDSPSDGRALKRIKRDVDVDKDCAENVTTTIVSRPPSAHSRSASQPNIGDSSYAQSGLGQQRASASRTSPVFGKDRARSVPVFPSSFSVPHIDLRNPPPSPRRARSRSPSKEREIKLRIMSGPTQVAKLETITDDNGPDAPTNDPILAPSAATPQQLSTSSHDDARGHANQETPANRRETTIKDSVRPSIPTVHEPPSTPATAQPLSLTFPLSPLTPLPPTPLPSSGIVRYITAEWDIDGDEEDKVRYYRASLIITSYRGLTFKQCNIRTTRWLSLHRKPSRYQLGRQARAVFLALPV